MNISKKTIIIILTLSLILILIIIFYLILINNKDKNNSIDSPTNNEPITSPTIIPEDFTGVMDEIVPDSEIEQVNQERTLRRTLPYTGATFIVSYDNYDDIFYVQLKEPVANAQADFTIWRNANASALPESRFQFR